MTSDSSTTPADDRAPTPAGDQAPTAPNHSAVVDDLDSAQSIAARVSAELEAFLADKAGEFESISPDATAIGQSLLEFTRGGKRIRPVLAWWGFQLAGGSVDAGTEPATGLAQAAGSLELLHAAALIHDDVIDNSDTRRGRPSLHRQFEARHIRHGLSGDAAAFGVSSSIVVGDICLALSEELFERAEETLGRMPLARRLRATVRRDVMVGQYLDVLAEVVALDDARIADRAWEVLSFKSAKYSVEQPLLLGAALAGASEDLLDEISEFGLPLGQAFQLRDDVLGITGDPQATGKPAGDDISEGKRTVLIAETAARISPDQLDILAARLGNPALSPAEVAECVDMITASGGLAAVESFIADKHAQARSQIETWAGEGSERIHLGRPAEERLKEFARALSYRTG